MDIAIHVTCKSTKPGNRNLCSVRALLLTDLMTLAVSRPGFLISKLGQTLFNASLNSGCEEVAE